MDNNSRAAAIHIIAKWLQTGAFPGNMLESVTENRAFVTELVYGAVRWRRKLEWVIDGYARQTPALPVTAALLAGLHQILHLDKVAAYAAVNETVAAVKLSGLQREAGFVNAILRRVLRERAELERRLAAQPLGIRLSHPDILLNRWSDRYGAGMAERLCLWNNNRAEVAVCANELKITDAGLQADLGARDFIERVAEVDGRRFFILKRGVAVPDLPGFAEGRLLAIDPAAANAVALLNVRPGQRVLDACAAPGGKTALIAGRMMGEGVLHAWEPVAERRERLCLNMRRLGIDDWVAVAGVNALHPPADAGLYDRILLDAPCSNTGVIRHKPDVRWNFAVTRLAKITELQAALLAAAAGLLKPGGRIVYSTCSLEPEENERLIRNWPAIRRAPKILDERAALPPDSGMDGFYAAAIGF